LKLYFLVLFFQIHLLGPIMHHLTKPHDFKFVVWSSGIQNKEPLFTVYPLYLMGEIIVICCPLWGKCW
jgi:hypothetical protein